MSDDTALTQIDPAKIINGHVAAMLERMAGITPKGLIEALSDPQVIQKRARGDLYIQLGLMAKLSTSPKFTMGHRLQYMNLLSRLSAVINPEDALPGAENLPKIVINMTQNADGAGATSQPKIPEWARKPAVIENVLEGPTAGEAGV